MKSEKLHPCAQLKFPDIPDLKFLRTDSDLYYFDATHLLKKAPLQDKLSIENFKIAFGYLIGTIQEASGIADEDLYMRDSAGTEYLEECLAIPFLFYVDRSFGPYTINRMEELLRFGFSINDNMAQFFFKARFDQ